MHDFVHMSQGSSHTCSQHKGEREFRERNAGGKEGTTTASLEVSRISKEIWYGGSFLFWIIRNSFGQKGEHDCILHSVWKHPQPFPILRSELFQIWRNTQQTKDDCQGIPIMIYFYFLTPCFNMPWQLRQGEHKMLSSDKKLQSADMFHKMQYNAESGYFGLND